MTVNRTRLAEQLGGALTGQAAMAGTGLVFASSAAPSVGINFYDGRFLRADDLNLEHEAQRAYVDYSNRAGGSGVAYGFDFLVDGGEFTLTSGLAIDRGGKLIYLPSDQKAQLESLFAADRVSSGSGSPGFAGLRDGVRATGQDLRGRGQLVVRGVDRTVDAALRPERGPRSVV